MLADRLRSIPLFAGLEKRELEALARATDELDFTEGEQLVEEGGFGYEFFVIEEGTAQVLHEGLKVAELGPGDFFGELALTGDARRTAAVVADSPMRAIVMTRSAFHQMKRDLPSVCERIESVVQQRGREVAQW